MNIWLALQSSIEPRVHGCHYWCWSFIPMHSPIYQTNIGGNALGESVPRGLSGGWAFLVSDLKCLIRKSWSFTCALFGSAKVWSWYVLASSNSVNFWALCSVVAILWSARQMTWCTKACQKFVASASSVSCNPVPVIGPLFPLTCHDLITYLWPHFLRWESFYVTILLSFNPMRLSIRRFIHHEIPLFGLNAISMISIHLWCMLGGTLVWSWMKSNLFQFIEGQTHLNTIFSCQNGFDTRKNQYRMFSLQTSTPPPSMHLKFTEHERGVRKTINSQSEVMLNQRITIISLLERELFLLYSSRNFHQLWTWEFIKLRFAIRISVSSWWKIRFVLPTIYLDCALSTLQIQCEGVLFNLGKIISASELDSLKCAFGHLGYIR